VGKAMYCPLGAATISIFIDKAKSKLYCLNALMAVIWQASIANRPWLTLAYKMEGYEYKKPNYFSNFQLSIFTPMNLPAAMLQGIIKNRKAIS